MKGVPFALIALGLGEMGLGGSLFRGRLWASVAVTAWTALTGLLSIIWVVYAFFRGFYAPLQLLVPMAMSVTLVVSIITIPFSMKLEKARQELLA